MTLPLHSLASRALSVPLSIGTTVISTGVGLAQRLPTGVTTRPVGTATAVAGRVKALATQGVEAALTHGLGTVAKLRGTPTQAEQVAAVESVLDPFSLPEPVAELVDSAAPGATLAHADLPLEDYDHLTLGSLRARIRRLDASALIQVRDYERAHANRLPVVMALDNRLKTLAAAAPGAGQATLVTV